MSQKPEVNVEVKGFTLSLSMEQYKRVVDALRFYSRFLDSELNVAHSLALRDAEVAAVDKIADEMLLLNEINAKFNTLSTQLVNSQESGAGDSGVKTK